MKEMKISKNPTFLMMKQKNNPDYLMVSVL